MQLPVNRYMLPMYSVLSMVDLGTSNSDLLMQKSSFRKCTVYAACSVPRNYVLTMGALGTSNTVLLMQISSSEVFSVLCTCVLCRAIWILC